MVIIDTEIYSDYFLLSALQLSTGKIKHFEAFDGQPLDRKAVGAFMVKHTTISFNGISLDRKSTRLNSSHVSESRMPSSA